MSSLSVCPASTSVALTEVKAHASAFENIDSAFENADSESYDYMGSSSRDFVANSRRRSRWTARAGTLLLRRDSNDNVPLITNNGGTGPVVLSGSDFGFDFEAGVEASLIFDNPNWNTPIEFRYFGINDWTDTRAANGLTNAVVNTTPNAGGFNTLDYANYESQLQSFELNFRRQVTSDLTLMAGFRYLSFDEDLDMLTNGGDQYWWGIQNDIFGVQVGGEYVFYDNDCNFKLEGFAKGGLYVNDANVATQSRLIEQAPVSEQNGMDHLSFVAELGLIGQYDLPRCWSLRAGYQMMWLDGVLVAANQVPATNTNGVTVGFDYTSLFFHGMMVQLQRRW